MLLMNQGVHFPKLPRLLADAFGEPAVGGVNDLLMNLSLRQRHAERSPACLPKRDGVEACSARRMLRLHLDQKAVEIALSMTRVHCSKYPRLIANAFGLGEPAVGGLNDLAVTHPPRISNAVV
jgi:hypothetical protein